MFDRLKRAGQQMKRELKVHRLVLKDRRTPKRVKLLLWLAIGYALLPFDIVPDFVPVVGHLDDIIIVPGLIAIALKMVPKEVLEDCRRQVDIEGTN